MDDFIFKKTVVPGLVTIEDGLSYAYVTSLLFYVLVEWIPDKKREKKALGILKEPLAKIFVLANRIIMLLELSATMQKITDMNHLAIVRDKIYYKSKCDKTMGEGRGAMIPIEDLPSISAVLEDEAKRISSSIVFSDCPVEITDIIGEILSSEVLKKIIDNNEHSSIVLGKYKIANLELFYNELKHMCQVFNEYYDDMNYYYSSPMNESEIPQFNEEMRVQALDFADKTIKSINDGDYVQVSNKSRKTSKKEAKRLRKVMMKIRDMNTE